MVDSTPDPKALLEELRERMELDDDYGHDPYRTGFNAGVEAVLAAPEIADLGARLVEAEALLRDIREMVVVMPDESDVIDAFMTPVRGWRAAP